MYLLNEELSQKFVHLQEEVLAIKTYSIRPWRWTDEMEEFRELENDLYEMFVLTVEQMEKIKSL